jgi:hypothetical protein
VKLRAPKSTKGLQKKELKEVMEVKTWWEMIFASAGPADYISTVGYITSTILGNPPYRNPLRLKKDRGCVKSEGGSGPVG